ncbi:Hypothetical protein PHPALM_3303 [Phytophthora palmivora]|uniref:Uncharacterized protein n=1 Tax=Phytophthora palmivora TaxID=4796 RepID=A0A2P4YMQ6_9STRA|nr:Hypothetical protein PHPALM_3303 [Phytophthora palmivora]
MIYTHVNRLLDRHSFRRGDAQHVNACDGLTQRWIFDRGAWKMSTTNTGFNCIFNTSREDHKRIRHTKKVKALSSKLFDAETQEKIAGVQRFLFATCIRMKSSKYNLSQQVIDILTAYLIIHYTLKIDLQADGLGVRRVEAAAAQTGVSVAELLAWSSHLAACQNTKRKASQEQAITSSKKPSEESKIIYHQRSVVDQLMEHTKRQDERMDNLEAKIDGTTSDNKSKKRQQEPSQEQVKPKRQRGSVTHLHTTWFAWSRDRLLERQNGRHPTPSHKPLVALMNLFVADDLKLDPSAVDYRDQVLELGRKAEAAVLVFLSDRAIKSRSSTAVRKHLLDLYVSGSLNDLVAKHIRFSQSAAFNDPDRQNPLEPVPVKIT